MIGFFRRFWFLPILVVLIFFGFNFKKRSSSEENSIPAPSPTPFAQEVKGEKKESLKDFSVAKKPKELLDGFQLTTRKEDGRIYSARGIKEISRTDSKTQTRIPKEVLDQFLAQQGLESLQYGEPSPSRVGESVQYFFPQVYEGISLYPDVGVSLTIEAGKRLVAIEADYVEGLQVAGVKPPQSPHSPGVPVVYYTDSGGTKKGVYANRSVKDGIETITEMGSGRIILKKNRRNY
jgi:hypothetical protein